MDISVTNPDSPANREFVAFRIFGGTSDVERYHNVLREYCRAAGSVYMPLTLTMPLGCISTTYPRPYNVPRVDTRCGCGKHWLVRYM